MLVKKLLLLVALVLAPVAVAEFWNLSDLYKEGDVVAAATARRTLDKLRSREVDIVAWMGEILTLLADGIPDVASDPAACRVFAIRVHSSVIPWVGATVMSGAGATLCAAGDPPLDGSIRSAPADAMTDGSPAFAGDVTREAPPSGTWTVPITVPWAGPSGERGVLSGRVDARWLATLVMAGPHDPGMDIVAEPREEGGGQPHPALARFAARTMSGQARAAWIDGSDRFLAYAPFGLAPIPGIFLAVGVDREAAMATLTYATRRTFAFFSATLLLSALGAWRAGRVFVSEPVAALTEAAGRWRDGDRTARVGLKGHCEIAELGRTFDRMADSIVAADVRARSSADMLDALSGVSGDCIYVKDADGIYLYANSATERFYGRLPGGLLGKADTEVGRLIGAEPRTFELMRDRLLAGGKPVTFEISLPDGSGGTRTLQTAYATLPDPLGGRPRIAGISRDVTVLKDAATELRRTRDEAEEANRQKDRFLAAASHDLRQPLQAAILYAGVACDVVNDPPEAVHALAGVRSALGDLKEMLDSLLDVSRLEAGDFEPRFASVPLESMFDSVRVSCLAAADAKGLELVVLPTSGCASSDPALLLRMTRNMVENAIRYTHSGSVIMGCSTVGGKLAIEITDTGIGIAEADRDIIWEGFRQLGNTERDRSMGVGLGLAIVRRLADLLGHGVTLQSEVGKGSRFSILVDPCDPPPPGEAAREWLPAAAGGGKLAVVVDDDVTLLAGLQMCLTARGYDVIASGCGEDAMEKVRTGGRIPSVILADYRLRGGETGASVIADLRRATGEKIPGIMLTGEHGDAPRHDAESLGVTLLRKPVLPRQLLAAIGRVTGTD